jgi:hypothetical protein
MDLKALHSMILESCLKMDANVFGLCVRHGLETQKIV